MKSVLPALLLVLSALTLPASLSADNHADAGQTETAGTETAAEKAQNEEASDCD